MQEPQNPPPNPIMDGSRFSTEERDMRWAKTRAMMQASGLDALVVFQGYRDTYHRYAWWLAKTGFMTPGAVILPLKGDPTVFGAPPWPGRWIEDTGPMGLPLREGIVARLNDAGATSVGVVGSEGGALGLNEFYDEGLACYATLAHVKAALPDVSFTDVTAQMCELMLVGSDEMIQFCTEACQKGDALQTSVLGMLGAGVTNRQIRAHIAQHCIMNDLVPDVEAIEMPPRPLAEGDVFNMENGLHYLGGYTQVTLAAAIGKISDELEAMNDKASEVLEIAKSETRPGRAFGDVVEPLTDMMKDAGYWHFFPQIHSLNPIALVGPIGRMGGKVYEPSRGRDVELKPGMLLSYEIAARKGPTDMVKIGGIGLVTQTGVKMLNEVGQRLQRI